MSDSDKEVKWIWWAFPQVQILIFALLSSLVLNVFQWSQLDSYRNESELLFVAEGSKISDLSKESTVELAKLKDELTSWKQREDFVSQRLEVALSEGVMLKISIEDLKAKLAENELRSSLHSKNPSQGISRELADTMR